MKHKQIGAAALAAALLFSLSGCAEQSKQASIFAMDTYCTLEAYGARADEALEAASGELNRLDALLSVSGADSDVARFNASDDASAEVSAETAALIARAKEIGEATDGAFDITVQPLVALWGFYGAEQRVPKTDEIEKALALVDARSLHVEGTRISGAAGQRIDLGGIAKGYAADVLAETLASYGVESALISLGGNVRACGSKPDGSAWRIGIRDPEDESGVLGVVTARDASVVTAGVYQRYFIEDGVRYHHIIDPATGVPAQSGLISATVICGDGAYADALSTALLVMGTERAVAYWRTHRDFDMVLVDETKCVYVTNGNDYQMTADLYKLHNLSNISE